MVIDHPTRGFLVLADISGFTEFVTTTEIEHGPPIVAALLEEVMQRISPPLVVQEVEGDAVFALALDGTIDRPGALLDAVNAAFEGFRKRQREMAMDDCCGCNACRNVMRLRLKIICHHGVFLRQTVGDRVQAAGADVILAHRLLKNGVASDASYALLTRPALEALDVDPTRGSFVPHVEHDEHFGTVDCFVAEPAQVALAA